MGAKAQNEKHNQQMQDMKILKESIKREGGQIQRDILVQKKKDEESTRDFIDNRMKWMAAITAIYYAAMGLAIYEEISALSSGIAAGTASCNFLATTLSTPCGVGYAGCFKGHLATCMGTMNTGVALEHAQWMSPTAVPTAIAKCGTFAQYAPGCVANTNAYNLIAWANCMPFSPASGLLGTLMAKGIVLAYTIGAAKTAGGSQIATYGALLSGLLMMLVPSLQKLVMAAYNFPIPRSITFGASAVLATAITAGLIQRKKIVEKNIKDLDEVIKQFKLQDTGIDLGAGNSAAAASKGINTPGKMNDPAKKSYALNGLAEGVKIKSSCMSATKDSFDYSPSSCSNALKVRKPEFNFKTGVPSLNNVGLMANEMANAISSGDTEKANLLAGSLASQAAKMKDLTVSLQSKLNDELKAQGKKAVDFDSSIKDQLASMQSSFNSAAGNKGMAQASFSSDDSSLSADDLKAVDSNKDQSIVSAPTIQIPVEPETDLSNMGSDSIDNDQVDSSEKIASLDDSLDNFEPNQSDILAEPEVSIFKQVSNRYKLNYQKILQRKQINPPLAAPQPSH
jgi:hypothetical protein